MPPILTTWLIHFSLIGRENVQLVAGGLRGRRVRQNTGVSTKSWSGRWKTIIKWDSWRFERWRFVRANAIMSKWDEKVCWVLSWFGESSRRVRVTKEQRVIKSFALYSPAEVKVPGIITFHDQNVFLHDFSYKMATLTLRNVNGDTQDSRTLLRVRRLLLETVRLFMERRKLMIRVENPAVLHVTFTIGPISACGEVSVMIRRIARTTMRVCLPTGFFVFVGPRTP